MEYHTVTYLVQNRVATITLNRPDAGNAINEQMHRELRSIWDRINDDDDVWIAVLTGAGDVFSVGDDIAEFADQIARERRPQRWQEMIAWQARYRGIDTASGIPEPSKGRPGKPLVGLINGDCWGSALLLLAHCDFVIAADQATFALPDVSYGLAPIDATIALTRLTMRPPIMRLALLGESETMSAERARQLGLVLETHPKESLQSRLDQLIENMLVYSAPLAVRGAKAAIWGTINLNWDDAHRWGHMFLHEVRFHSEDAKEGPRSFAEKRRPNWQAR